MRSVQQALSEILAHFSAQPAESIPLHKALGRTLAVDVRAVDDLPHFDNSAMDGYAVKAADTRQLPARLRVIGEIPAGVAPEMTLSSGEAVRIMTGAPAPDGADLIVPVEDTDQNRSTPELSEWVEIHAAGESGTHIRRRGEDVQAGEQILLAGHLLRPQDLGLLAGLGVADVSVVRKPRIAVFSTGDELLAVDQALRPGKIRDMNRYSLSAMVTSLNAEALFLGVATDTLESVRGLLQEAVDSGADLILSSAGVSVGTHDVVKTVLEEMGAIGFWKVNMRPGKPLAFGHVRDIPFLGLPGNPVSALASFEVFVRPAILKMLGQPVDVPYVPVRVGEDMKSDGRESYIRVRLIREEGEFVAVSTGTQSSAAISSLVKADALLVIPAGRVDIRVGDQLQARPFAGQRFW